MNYNSVVKKHILIICTAAIFCIALTVSEVYCPIKYFTGVICPACGVLRAWLALFKLDIKASLLYNPMAVPLTLAVLLFIHRKLFKHKKAVGIYCAAVLIINAAVYLYRLLNL